MDTASFAPIIKTVPRTISHIINKQRLSKYRLIFCINSGRAGSNYLAELLDSAVGVNSFHEPNPKMIGKHLNLINQHKYEATFKKRNFKVGRIKDMLLRLPEKSVYCETSHMFIKTFFDVVMEGFPGQVEVIVLRRYLSRVVKSFIELDYFSDRNKTWPLWMSSPNATTSAIACLDLDNNLDQYDLIIAYLIDIEARFLRFKTQYPNIKLHEVRVESLNVFSNTKTFFEQLRITPSKMTEDLCSKQVNQKKQTKKKYSSDKEVDLNYCQERIYNYIQKAKAQNIKIPETLALDEFSE